MADPQKVKLFKQYLIDTKAFQTLAETLSMLHKSDPKPDDAMQFIRKRLSGPIDAEEFQCMKKNLSKLDEDMGQMKADITNISNMVSKLLPTQPTDIDQSLNVSVPSMENNVGDSSHISMLDDSSLIFDQSVMNAGDDLNSTMHTDDEPQLNCSVIDESNTAHTEDALNNSTQGFTMEFVEVDVVNKSALDFSLVSQDGNANEEMQVDESVVKELTVTSTPEPTATATTTPTLSTADANVAELNIDELPIVFKEEDSQEQLTLSQGFHGFDIHDIEESKKHLPGAKADEIVEQEMPEPIVKEDPNGGMVQETPEVHDEPKTEPIESQVSSVIGDSSEVENENMNVEVENALQDEPPTDSEAPIEPELPIELELPVEPEVPIESEMPAVNSVDEKRSIVEGILDKVVEEVMEVGESEVADNMTDAVNTPVDGPTIETNEVTEVVTDNGDGCASECIAILKDDAETQLFLSYS